jgi:hypothetical protein
VWLRMRHDLQQLQEILRAWVPSDYYWSTPEFSTSCERSFLDSALIEKLTKDGVFLDMVLKLLLRNHLRTIRRVVHSFLSNVNVFRDMRLPEFVHNSCAIAYFPIIVAKRIMKMVTEDARHVTKSYSTIAAYEVCMNMRESLLVTYFVMEHCAKLPSLYPYWAPMCKIDQDFLRILSEQKAEYFRVKEIYLIKKLEELPCKSFVEHFGQCFNDMKNMVPPTYGQEVSIAHYLAHGFCCGLDVA